MSRSLKSWPTAGGAALGEPGRPRLRLDLIASTIRGEGVDYGSDYFLQRDSVAPSSLDGKLDSCNGTHIRYQTYKAIARHNVADLSS